MSKLSKNEQSHLVAGRECGECTACCVDLYIKDGDFEKPAEQACPNMIEKGGCKIYAKRPSVCQNWHCAWRFMEQLSDEWRPDRIGILLRSDENGIIFQPIRDPQTVLTNARVIELIGGGIAQGIPMSMSIPTQKNYRSYSVVLNEPLQDAVSARSLPLIQDKMIELIEFASSQNTSAISITEL